MNQPHLSRLDAECGNRTVGNSMRRLLPVISLLLLALWLPATQHCALEDTGLVAQTCQDNCAGGNSEKDGCRIVEDGAYKPATNILKAPAPSLLACVCFLCLQPAPQVLADGQFLPGEQVQRSESRIAAWHFVRRAAPLPGAPSAAIA